MSILDINIRNMLKKIEATYWLKLPRKVVMIGYTEEGATLYIRFRNVDHSEGEPTPDGKIILHHDPKGKIAAIESKNITTL